MPCTARSRALAAFAASVCLSPDSSSSHDQARLAIDFHTAPNLSATADPSRLDHQLCHKHQQKHNATSVYQPPCSCFEIVAELAARGRRTSNGASSASHLMSTGFSHSHLFQTNQSQLGTSQDAHHKAGARADLHASHWVPSTLDAQTLHFIHFFQSVSISVSCMSARCISRCVPQSQSAGRRPRSAPKPSTPQPVHLIHSFPALSQDHHCQLGASGCVPRSQSLGRRPRSAPSCGGLLLE